MLIPEAAQTARTFQVDPDAPREGQPEEDESCEKYPSAGRGFGFRFLRQIAFVGSGCAAHIRIIG